MAAAKPGEIADRSLEFFNQVRDSGSERVGAWTDDPDNKAGVFAAVHRGKLKELVIPNSYMGLDPTTLSTILNAVIINAYIEWTPAQQSARANAARQQEQGTVRDPHPDPRIAELMHRLAEATANSRSTQASLTELRIERAKLVNDLRASGVTDRRIAAHLGIHPSALQRLAGSKRSQSQKADTA